MEIPLNAPRGSSQNKRLRRRGGKKAADFPEPMVLDRARASKRAIAADPLVHSSEESVKR